ncbi:XRE family transcriptional regulator [Sphingobium indicum]|uniref:XRE family transcriptional regulator n=1 Tax=Sphingobium indicum TaxID=332055 RepID=A0A4Q4J8S1_9SPHN|nr:helix-turn-helix transcriptional regulator [Sphingobium indicum]KEZ00394.1 XRE family transcriptional regulator [Sphingomonas sp. BHC-A]NYI22449.1 transcriptional regulator with XRE-family HTH domain [Sphingobium indicum]RYM02555.1 XRE family transcriptional regulator [Sphingobium indicum]
MEVDPDLVPLGEAVRQLRKARGLTQEDLSGLTELHRNHIGGIERGERNITIKTMLALARALDVQPAELFSKYRISAATRP